MSDDKITPYRLGKDGPVKGKRVKASDYAQEYLQEALDFQVKVMRDEEADPKYRLQAAQALINRAAGRETQKIESTTTHEEKKTMVFEARSISLDARKELMAAMRNGDVIEAEVTDIEDVKELPYDGKKD